MNETVRIIIIVDFAVLLLDIITITDLRRFLLDFISGKKVVYMLTEYLQPNLRYKKSPFLS